MTWIAFTLFAAFMQSWRNAFQSKLSTSVNTVGVTLARFLWASPIAALYLILLYQWQPVAKLNITQAFIIYAISAAIMQIIATALMVKLFQLNNYAIGAGLAKSEAIVAAIFGLLFFGTSLTLLGALGVFIGGIAIFYLSKAKNLQHISIKTLLLGLASGSAFALTSLWIREASLTLDLPFSHRAAWVLLTVISIQTLMLLFYLAIFDKKTLVKVYKDTKLTPLISITSCLGSIGWFTAMSLESVPYVKTLGQVEIFFTMLISTIWLKEPIKKHSALGLIMIAIAAILVIWG